MMRINRLLRSLEVESLEKCTANIQKLTTKGAEFTMWPIRLRPGLVMDLSVGGTAPSPHPARSASGLCWFPSAMDS